jgi:hypothetical protein
MSKQFRLEPAKTALHSGIFFMIQTLKMNHAVDAEPHDLLKQATLVSPRLFYSDRKGYDDIPQMPRKLRRRAFSLLRKAQDVCHPILPPILFIEGEDSPFPHQADFEKSAATLRKAQQFLKTAF